MNRKIAISGFSILTALTLLTTSAFAAFTTTATATGNTFSSGTDNLLVSTDNVTFSSSVTNPFNGNKLTPGTVKTFTFYLKNDNTNSTDDLDVIANFSGGTADATLDGALVTQFSCSNGATPGAFNVTAMRAGQVSLGTVLSGQVVTCTFNVTLPSSATNAVSGKTTSFDVNFNGTGVLPTVTPTITPTPTGA